MRLFVAIDVPETHAAALAGLRSDDLEARWTPAGQFHLTLRFLGDVEDERAGDVAAALGAIPGEPFRLHAQGLDVFPSRRNPRVLVVRVEDEPRLMRLQRGVDAAVRRLGVAADPKSFHPHVTLGRFKRVRSQEVRHYLRAHQAFALPPFDVAAFHLYKSTLGPEGAVHERVATFALPAR